MTTFLKITAIVFSAVWLGGCFQATHRSPPPASYHASVNVGNHPHHAMPPVIHPDYAQRPIVNASYRSAPPPPPSPQEIAILRKSAAHQLGRNLDEYQFQGNQQGPTPPRQGCIFDQKVKDPNVPGLYHTGWRCPRR